GDRALLDRVCRGRAADLHDGRSRPRADGRRNLQPSHPARDSAGGWTGLMQILERSVYVGPNLYARFPVVRLLVDLGELEKWPSAKISGFTDRLLKVLPTLEAHGCAYGEAGGFVRRLREGDGTWMGHILEHV